jgi:hypothetical protein
MGASSDNTAGDGRIYPHLPCFLGVLVSVYDAEPNLFNRCGLTQRVFGPVGTG